MTANDYPIDLGFILTKAPLESGLTTNALKIATEAMDQGKKVALFLISDGVWLAKRNQKNHAADIFAKLLQNEIPVMASDVHLAAAGIHEDQIQEGVMITKKPYKVLVTKVMEEWKKVVTI